MCLLDGTIGGNIFASHDFGKIELRHADGSIEYEPIKVYDIIRNAVHEYAHAYVAKKMGVTTQSIIEQASAWSRLGLVK